MENRGQMRGRGSEEGVADMGYRSSLSFRYALHDVHNNTM